MSGCLEKELLPGHGKVGLCCLSVILLHFLYKAPISLNLACSSFQLVGKGTVRIGERREEKDEEWTLPVSKRRLEQGNLKRTISAPPDGEDRFRVNCSSHFRDW